MLLNFGLPQKAPNIVSAPKPQVDINSILGLAPSQYEGLQKVGDTGYFYGDNRMYEPYKPSPTFYYKNTPFGTQYYNSGIGMYANSAPSSHPIFGISGGWSQGGGSDAGTIYKGEQAFRPISEDVAGFSKTKGDDDIYTYDPSMAYVYSQTPKYQGYDVASAEPVISLTAPTAMNFTGSSGAGRFLGGTDGLLGAMPLSFGLPSGESANG